MTWQVIGEHEGPNPPDHWVSEDIDIEVMGARIRVRREIRHSGPGRWMWVVTVESVDPEIDEKLDCFGFPG